MANTVNIDGKAYDFDSLSDEAKKLLASIRFADAKLTQLQQEAAMVQTARRTYANALADALPKDAA